MGMNFQAAVKDSMLTEKKVFVKDLYPGLENDYFENDPYVLKDDVTGELYEVRHEADFIYEHGFSYDSFYALMEIIDHNLAVLTKKEACFDIKHENLPAFQRKIIFAINSSKTEKHAYPMVQHNNFVYGGLSKDRIISGLETMLEITNNAIQRKLDIFWA